MEVPSEKRSKSHSAFQGLERVALWTIAFLALATAWDSSKVNSELATKLSYLEATISPPAMLHCHENCDLGKTENDSNQGEVRSGLFPGSTQLCTSLRIPVRFPPPYSCRSIVVPGCIQPRWFLTPKPTFCNDGTFNPNWGVNHDDNEHVSSCS